MDNIDRISISAAKFEQVRKDTMTERPMMHINGAPVGNRRPLQKPLSQTLSDAMDTGIRNARRVRDHIETKRESSKCVIA